MRKFAILIVSSAALALASGMFAPCHADEAPPAANDKKDAGEAKGEGGDDASKKKKAGDVSGGQFAGDPVYVHLNPIVLPIINDTGPEQLVTIQITIQVKDFDVADDIHTNMPRVMDALIQSLYGGLSSGNLRNGRVVNVGKVKTQATAAIRNLEGGDNIKDVLITNMSQRLL